MLIRAVIPMLAILAGLSLGGCNPHGDGLLEIRVGRYFETRTDNPTMDARYAVHEGVWPVEITAYQGKRPAPDGEGLWHPGLWIGFKYHGRSESLSTEGLTCTQAKGSKLVTCVGKSRGSGVQRGPSAIHARLLGDKILALEILELEAPASEFNWRFERPTEGWPRIVAESRHDGCRWGEPLRCD